MTLRDGVTARVSGAQMPGGRIDVKYMPDGTDQVAANSGDYIYPADVRFDHDRELLYVKTSGTPAVSFWRGPQTWVFEYDLGARRRIARVRVDPAVLPQQCPERP
jgi:hypothetical protein